MQAIRYHRFSTRRQDKGSSIERQSETTQALCDAKGWTVIETIEDKGQSAWKGDHLATGQLGKLRARIDAGLIAPGTHLVVENLDRLSRQDYRTARRWIEDITDHDIIVSVCAPALTLDSDAMSGANIGPMIQHLLESNRATAESARKSTFQKKNIARMTDMIRAGLCPSPNVPLWLHGVVGEPLTIIPERAALVGLIYEWCASGLGLQSICQKLNASHPAWSVAGWKTGKEQWRIGYVRDILRSPAVEGRYVRKDAARNPVEVITGYYPRIVDADLVSQARAAIDRRAGTGGAKSGEAKNYFAGLMTCAACGGTVGRVSTGRTERAHAYLTCRNARYGTCDNRAGMPYETLARVMVDHLLHLALDDTHFASTDDVAPLMAKTTADRTRIETLTTEQDNLVQVLRKMPTSVGIIEELGRIETELAAAKAQLAASEADLLTARGTVSPSEHLQRVKTVSESLATDPAARRMVRDALPSLIETMVWDGTRVAVSSANFLIFINREGEVSGYDLFHPRSGHKYHPDYGRRRAEAIDQGNFMPLAGANPR